MTIRQNGGIFGRNPAFNEVDANVSKTDFLYVGGTTALLSGSVAYFDNHFEIKSNRAIKWGDGDAKITGLSSGLIYQDADDTVFRSSNTSSTFARINSNGLLFNGDTAAANALDDYEEGTWTPVPADAASGGNTGTAAQFEGIYTKIGNTVFVQFGLLNINTSGLTAGNDFYIQGLPFAAGNTTLTSYATGACIPSGNISYTGGIVAAVTDNQSAVRLAETASGSNVDYVIVSELTSGASDIWASLVYRTA